MFDDFAPQDSYALCRVFKKTIIQVPKTKEEEMIGNNQDKDSVWVLDDQQLFEDDTSGSLETSRGKEADDENFIHDYSNNKLPSDTSSSDLTQGTPAGMADDFHAPFASDEANSAADFCSLGVDFPTNLLIQVKHLHY